MSNLFGRSFSDVGQTSSDFLIKTRGQVKIQIGNKFIDLIKDGKINVESKFIYESDEIGTKDGIYVIKNNGDVKVSLVVDGQEIELVGDKGTTYVSFLEGQETNSESKYNALKNIGFIYDTLDAINENSLKNGIIYVSSEQKLYTIKNGVVSEFTIDLQNPFKEQFIIQKQDKTLGSLVIKGEGKENSLLFNSLYIYQKGDESYIDSKGNVHIFINNKEYVSIEQDKTKFYNIIQSDNIQSEYATSDSGFRLYNLDQSCLEIDKLIVRQELITPDSETNSSDVIQPKQWNTIENVIKNVRKYEDETSSQQGNVSTSYDVLEINLFYENKFKVNDYLYTYINISDEITESLKVELVAFKVIDQNDSRNITVQLQKDYMPQELDSLESLISKHLYLIGSEQGCNLLKLKNQNLDLILNSKSFSDEENIKTINTRIGNLKELQLSYKESGQNKPINSYGTYSKNSYFLNAGYTSDYVLPSGDNSSKFASTEWANKLIPKGAIIMYNGQASEIPDGWHICDGTNGTPNLIGNFIKASNVAGESGGSNEIQILEENLPSHTHTFIDNNVTTSESGNHTHSIINEQVTTSKEGGHTHTFQGTYANCSSSNDINVIQTGQQSDYITTSESGVHNHTINTADIQLNQSGSHNHNVDLSNNKLTSVGQNKSITYQPKYYSLIYIMRI